MASRHFLRGQGMIVPPHVKRDQEEDRYAPARETLPWDNDWNDEDDDENDSQLRRSPAYSSDHFYGYPASEASPSIWRHLSPDADGSMERENSAHDSAIGMPDSARVFRCNRLANDDTECSAVFVRKADLTRHIECVHDNKPKFSCPIENCSRKGDQGFTRRDHRTEHLKYFQHRAHHREIPKRPRGNEQVDEEADEGIFRTAVLVEEVEELEPRPDQPGATSNGKHQVFHLEATNSMDPFDEMRTLIVSLHQDMQKPRFRTTDLNGTSEHMVAPYPSNNYALQRQLLFSEHVETSKQEVATRPEITPELQNQTAPLEEEDLSLNMSPQVSELSLHDLDSPASGSDVDSSVRSNFDLDELEDWVFDSEGFSELRPFLQHVTLVLTRSIFTRALYEISNKSEAYASRITCCANGAEVGSSSSGFSSASSSQAPNANTSSASSNGKRKRSNGEAPNDGDSNKMPRLFSKSSLPLDVYVAYFACPFYKNCPSKHQRRACRQQPPSFKTVHRVKQHVYDSHSLPIRCNRCGATYDESKALEEHQQAEIACEKFHFSVEPSEGIDKGQESKLRSKAGIQKLSEKERWEAMYQIIFGKDCEMPSPYVDCQFENERCTREERARLGTLMLGPFPARAAQELGRFIGRTDQATINGLESLVARCVRETLSDGLTISDGIENDNRPPATSEPNVFGPDAVSDGPSGSSNQHDWFRQVQVEDPVQARAILESIRQGHPQIFQFYIAEVQPESTESTETPQFQDYGPPFVNLNQLSNNQDTQTHAQDPRYNASHFVPSLDAHDISDTEYWSNQQYQKSWCNELTELDPATIDSMSDDDFVAMIDGNAIIMDSLTKGRDIAAL